MHLLLTLMLALDLTGIKSEPRLEKRSQLALQFADSDGAPSAAGPRQP